MTQNNRGGFLNDNGAPVQPAGDAAQAALDAQWWPILTAANVGTGVVSGGMVSAPGGLAVRVEGCQGAVLGAPASTPAATITIAAPGTGEPFRRFDLIVIRDGVLTLLPGTPAGIACFPALAKDASSGELTDVALASVLVKPGVSAITAEDITLLGVPPTVTSAQPLKAASLLPYQLLPTGDPDTDYAVQWSYNGTNGSHLTTIVQDNVCTTSTGDIYSVFVNQSKNITVTQHLAGDPYCTAVNLGGLTGDPFETGTDWTTDAHDYMCLGVSSDGYLHVAGNMHAQTLKYARVPLATFSNLATWTAGDTANGGSGADGWGHQYLAMTTDSAHEIQDAADSAGTRHGCTYPSFIRLSNGLLVFVYRWGQSGAGDIYINRWNTTTHAWNRVGRAVNELTPDVGGQNWSAYPQKIVPGTDRDLHYMFCNRNTTSETTNVGMYYARFTNLDGTMGCVDSAGNAKVLPLVHDPSFAANRRPEVASSTGSPTFLAPNLMNNGGLCLDRDGYPHACISARADTASPYQHWHLWRSSTGWHQERITQFGGTVRSHIVTTPANETFIVGLGPGGIRAWNCTPGGTREDFLLARFDEVNEITYDTRALYEHGLLRMFIGGGQGWYVDGGDDDISPGDGTTPPIADWAVGTAALTQPRTVAAILTIDLTQMDAFRNGTAHLPGINVVATSGYRDRGPNPAKTPQGVTAGDGWVNVGSGDAIGTIASGDRIATTGPILVSRRTASRILFVKHSCVLQSVPSGQWASTCVLATDDSDATDNFRRLAPLWWDDNDGDRKLQTTSWCGMHQLALGNLGWATTQIWCSGGNATYIGAEMIELGELDCG